MRKYILTGVLKQQERIKMGLVNLETLFAAKRGEKYREMLRKKYPDGLTGKVGEAFMVRMKIWDSAKKEKNRSWNIVAWRDDSGYPHTLRNELLWRLYLIFPVRWEERLKYMWLDDVYEVVYHSYLYDDRGQRYPFILSLFPGEYKMLPGKKVRIKDYGCVAHPFHRFLIGSDYEIYPKDVEVLE